MKPPLQNLRWFLAVALILSQANVSAQKDEDFADGIGFYTQVGSQFSALTWTASISDPKQVNEMEPETSFYSYGLDFSQATAVGPVPPHLIGYNWGYLHPNGSKEGDWAIRFIPVSGTKEKLYRLRFDGPWESIRSGQIPHRLWYLRTPGRGGDEAFIYKFRDPAEAAAQKMSALLGVLKSSQRIYSGNLSYSMIWGPQVRSFKIRFTQFEEASGKIEAEVCVSGESDSFSMEGRLQGTNLTLNSSKRNEKWDINASEPSGFTGSIGGGKSSGTVDIDLTSFSLSAPPATGTPTPTQAPPDSRDFAQMILGGWRGEKYVTTYRKDGTYSMTPISPDAGQPKPDGTWHLEGNTLTKTYPGKPSTVYTILSLTSEKLTIKDDEGITYSQDRSK